MTEEQAYTKLSAICARAEHCVHDVTEKMRRWGMDDDAQTRVVRRLVDGRFIDEERYCRAFIRDKMRQNKWGRLKIGLALRMKHIPDSLAERALDEVEPSAYGDTLRHILEAKAKTVKAGSHLEMKAKLLRFAYGRGYQADEALAAIEEVLR